MPIEPGKIRNVAVVGHRGTGKTSLVEALLFQAEATNRLGSIDAGTHGHRLGGGRAPPPDVAVGVARAPHWQDRKINLIDTPGDSGLPGGHGRRACASSRARSSSVSGVMGVEVNTSRVWSRAEELELSRVVFVNMLDRERADFYACSPRCRSSSRTAASRSSCRSAPSTRSPASSTCCTMRLPGSVGRLARGRPGRDPGDDGRDGRGVPRRSFSTRSSRPTRR